MLLTSVVLVLLLLTADWWFPFIIRAGTTTFWGLVTLMAISLLVALFHNIYLLLVPLLFCVAVVVYAIAYNRFVDGPRLAASQPNRISP